MHTFAECCWWLQCAREKYASLYKSGSRQVAILSAWPPEALVYFTDAGWKKRGLFGCWVLKGLSNLFVLFPRMDLFLDVMDIFNEKEVTTNLLNSCCHLAFS